MALLLVVDGVVIQDDGNILANMRAKWESIMAEATLLDQAIVDLRAKITACIAEIEQMLVTPAPDVVAAQAALADLNQTVDMETQKLHDLNNPLPTP